MKKAQQVELFGGYKTWSLLDLMKEMGRIRRLWYGKQMAYEAKQKLVQISDKGDMVQG